MNRNRHRVRKMKKQKNMLQIKKKLSETDLKEMEIHDLPDRDFKITIIKMPTEVRRTVQGENFDKEKNFKVPNRNHRPEE